MSEEGTGEVTPEWTDGLDETGKGFVANKGWKSAGDALASYQSLEALRGVPEDRILKLPLGPDDAEGWGAVHARLGRPAEAKDYQLPEVEPVDEGGIDLAPDFREWAHDAGLSQSQANSIYEKYIARLGGLQGEIQEQQRTQIAADQQALRQEWGTAYEANIMAAKRFAKSFGLSEEWLSDLEGAPGVNYLGLMRGAARIGNTLGEHPLVEDRGEHAEQFGLTPAAAKAKAEELRNSAEYQEAALGQDSVARKAAMEQMNRLMRLAYPEDS